MALRSFTRSLFGNHLFVDEMGYQAWARAIIDGRPHVGLSVAPLPAYLMAAVYELLSFDPVHVRVLNVIFGVLACGFIFAIGREMGGSATGLLAAALAALYKPFVFFDVTLLKESLCIFLFSGMVYLVLAQMERPSAVKLLFVGFFVGLLSNTRQNAVVVLVAIGPYFAWQAFQSSRSLVRSAAPLVWVISGVLMAIVPLSVLQYRNSGDPMPNQASAGFELYLGNYLPSQVPYYRPVPFAEPSPLRQGMHFTVEASRRAGRKLSAAEASKFWMHQVLGEAREQPRRFAWRTLQKGLAVFNRFEESDNVSIDLLEEWTTFFSIPLFGFWLIMPLGAAALAAAGRESRKAAVLCWMSLAYVATLVIFYSNMRSRLPLLVVLIPCAAWGLVRIVRFRTQPKRWWIFYCAVLLLCGGVAMIPLPGTGDRSADYNRIALAMTEGGLPKEAAKYWDMSWESHGAYSVYGVLARARLELADGDTRSALEWLDRCEDGSFAASEKYGLMGDALRMEGRWEEAAAAYERALAINWGRVEIHQKLVELYRRVDPSKAKAAEEDLRYVESFQ